MFDKYFEVLLADTTEAKKIHYQIRYQVYCEEMGFEDKANFLKEEEWDKWDKSSVHFIVKHKFTGQWVGAMRLVKPENNLLPVNEHTDLVDEEGNGLVVSSNNVELSRLCLIKEIRRHSSDDTPPYGVSDDYEQKSKTEEDVKGNRRRLNLSLIWGLFRAAVDYSEQNNIHSWYFLTNKALARIIGREGFKLHNVGESCEHAGRRYPFKANMDEISAQISSSTMASNVLSQSYSLFSDYVANDLSADVISA